MSSLGTHAEVRRRWEGDEGHLLVEPSLYEPLVDAVDEQVLELTHAAQLRRQGAAASAPPAQ